jgi:hypothetical protein
MIVEGTRRNNHHNADWRLLRLSRKRSPWTFAAGRGKLAAAVADNAALALPGHTFRTEEDRSPKVLLPRTKTGSQHQRYAAKTTAIGGEV